MRTIYKYLLIVDASQFLSMPTGAEILCVQTQHGEPHLWAVVDTDQPQEEREIIMRGTGHPLNGQEGRYIGTVQTHGGGLVWHLFERQD